MGNVYIGTLMAVHWGCQSESGQYLTLAKHLRDTHATSLHSRFASKTHLKLY